MGTIPLTGAEGKRHTAEDAEFRAGTSSINDTTHVPDVTLHLQGNVRKQSGNDDIVMGSMLEKAGATCTTADVANAIIRKDDDSDSVVDSTPVIGWAVQRRLTKIVITFRKRNLHDTILLKVTMLTIELEDAQMTSGLLAEENAKLSARLEDIRMNCKYLVDEND